MKAEEIFDVMWDKLHSECGPTLSQDTNGGFGRLVEELVIPIYSLNKIIAQMPPSLDKEEAERAIQQLIDVPKNLALFLAYKR